jgi:uncharacterized membrane protein
MKHLVSFIIACLMFTSCNIPEETKDTVPLSKLDAIEELAAIEEVKTTAPSKLLMKASFTEPFMYAEIFSDKAVFTFPEKDTLIWKQAFDSLSLSKDLTLSGVEGTHTINIQLENKPCIHPGSGETWGKKAKVDIDKVIYQGCANSVK